MDYEELLRLRASDLIEQSGLAVMIGKNADAALKLMESRPDIRLLPFCRGNEHNAPPPRLEH